MSIIVKFGDRMHGGMVKFNSRVRVDGFSTMNSCRARPIIIGSDVVITLSTLPRMGRIRQCSAGPKVVGASSTFRKVILGKINPRFSPAFFHSRLVRKRVPTFDSATSAGRMIVSGTVTSELGLGLKSGVCACFVRGSIHTHQLAIGNVCRAGFSRCSGLFLLASLCLIGHLGG